MRFVGGGRWAGVGEKSYLGGVVAGNRVVVDRACDDLQMNVTGSHCSELADGTLQRVSGVGSGESVPGR